MDSKKMELSKYPDELHSIFKEDKDLIVLYEIVREVNPDIILELGVRGGHSTETFLRAGCKKLISIDAEDYPKTRERLGSFKNWEFIVQDDREYLKRIDYYPNIVFIDTSHTFQHTLFEIKQSARILAQGGIILLHDTLAEKYRGDIMRAVEYFILDNFPDWEFKELGILNGMGLVRMKDKPYSLRDKLTILDDVDDWGYLEFLYTYTKLISPARVLETGTYTGRSACAIATGLKENKLGHLWTIDTIHRSKFDERIEKLDLNEYVTPILGSSLECDFKPPFDFVFLDALHTPDFVKKELERYGPFTSRILIHDVTVNNPVWKVGLEYAKLNNCEVYDRNTRFGIMEIKKYG